MNIASQLHTGIETAMFLRRTPSLADVTGVQEREVLRHGRFSYRLVRQAVLPGCASPVLLSAADAGLEIPGNLELS